MSWTVMNTWQDQYFRMHRSYQKIPKYAKINDQNAAEFFDAWYHFFMDVSHLRDWIGEELSSILHGASKVKEEIATNNQYRHIKICAEIANRAKHLKLDTPEKEVNYAAIIHAPLERGQVPVSGLSYPMPPEHLQELRSEQQEPAKMHTLTINDPKSGRHYDIWDVARKALQEWDQYLKDHCIPLPGS